MALSSYMHVPIDLDPIAIHAHTPFCFDTVNIYTTNTHKKQPGYILYSQVYM